MTNATLSGKSDVGSLHVRFDEGEVASAEPRCGSLLMKMLTVMVMAIAVHPLMADALQDALNNQTLVFTTGGDANWFAQSGISHDGSSAARSGAVAPSQSSWIETVVNGPAIVSYWWRGSGDGTFRFSCDGCSHGCSGSFSWNRQRQYIPSGECTIKWEYESYYDYSGCGYLDEVKVDTIESILGTNLTFSLDDGWSLSQRNGNDLYVICEDELSAGDEYTLSSTVNGPGVIRFRTEGNLYYEGHEFGVLIDDEIAYSKKCVNYKQQHWSGATVEVPILTKGDHTVVWYVKNDSDNEVYGGVVGIADVVWEPAPANITVTFDSEGGWINGEESYSKTFATGETYGSLPIPVRDNRTFEGWYTDDGERISATDYVIPSVANLTARWIAEFPGACGDIESSAGIHSDRDGVVVLVDGSEYVEVSCEGEAIVSFEYELEGEQESPDEYSYVSANIGFWVDGSWKDYASAYLNAYSGGIRNGSGSRYVRATLGEGVHRLRWEIPYYYSENARAKLKIKNFSVEPIQDSVVEGESIVSFDWIGDIVANQGQAYWSLSAQREFTIDGVRVEQGSGNLSFSQNYRATNSLEHVRVHIPSGTHRLRMVVPTANGRNVSPDFRIENYKVEKIVPIQVGGESIVTFDWVTKVSPKSDAWDLTTSSILTVDGEAYGHEGFGRQRVFSGGMTNDRIRVRMHLTPGVHNLSCIASCAFGENASADFVVENFKVEEIGTYGDIASWLNLIGEFGVWKPENLAYLRDSAYGARITADPNDHEARVSRAAVKLALLAENKEIRNFINDCGWTIADYTMKMSGGFCGLADLAPANDIVDRLSPVALTALDDALEDLNAIPENWNGAIELSPKEYEVLNESVYVDMAEIALLKAALEAVRASILLVKGYDFTMDYVAVSNAIKNAEYVWDILEQAPEAGCIRDANALLESKAWFKKSLQHIRRADQIILWRSNPLPHFFEYDLVDADNLARARLYLEQLIGSLDHPETIDLPYFADKFGYKGETLPMGMFRQLYLGAVFAGRVTKDLVPDAQIRPAMLYMDTVADTTLGGLFPDLGFEEFSTLFPCGQHWSLALYDEYKPQSRLVKNQTLTVADESLCDGTLEYTANLQKLSHVTAQCIVDGLAVDTISVGDEVGAAEDRSVAIPNGSQYSLVFTASDHSMKTRQQLFEIINVPEVSPVGNGTYSQTVKGVTWNFTVSDDEATVTGVSGTINGDLLIPEKLGGRVVTAIAEEAFRKSAISSITIPATVKNIGIEAFARAESLKTVRFLGEEPVVGEDAFNKVSATVIFSGGTVLSGLEDGKWQGMTVQYVADETNEDLRVCASLPDGYEFNGMATLSLSVNGDATIYFTMNGAEPTTNALVYASPISVSITTRIKYFAVDNANGDSGPVGSLLLKLVTPDSALLSNSEYSKTVNGIAWSYQEHANGVRLTGNNGTAAGEKVAGAVVVPDAINWQPVRVVGSGLFASCEGITSVKIPATVTDIERDAFRGCTRLEAIGLPDGLLSIADGAFERCTSLSNVVIPASVTNIGYFAFRDCLRLTDVVLKGDPPRQDLGVYMGVPAFTTISGRMGSATAIVYAGITNKTEDIIVPENWLDELAIAHDKPAGADSYQAAFKAKYGDDLKAALIKPTGKYDLKGNPLYVWQDYVAGTDPLDEEDKFTATITISNGVPVVCWHPKLTDAAAALRKYTVYGATALDGKWNDVSDKTDEQRHDLGYQFFSVTVEMK